MTTYPFPGMNPWLEYPSLWGDVHFRLMASMSRYLGPRVSPRYYVSVGTRAYVVASWVQPYALRYPDVAVVQPQLLDGASTGASQTTTLTSVARPVPIQVPTPEVIEETYLEVREARTGQVVTVIEILSPTNKRPGIGRQKYERKRLEIFSTHTNLVEIDLLRAWPPMPFVGYAQSSHYRILRACFQSQQRRLPRRRLVHFNWNHQAWADQESAPGLLLHKHALIRRGEKGDRADLYPCNVRESIPCFPLPLQEGDVEPVIDLHAMLCEIYEEGRYHWRIDYDQPPEPPLAAARPGEDAPR